jgi:hypothetical protein
MATISTRLLVGFGAGALSHVLFQGALGAVLYTAGVLPHLVWSAAPVGPLAIPTTLNNMFWDGLWGVIYGLLEPRLTLLLGRFGGGAAIGFAAALVFWFVVLPLKGAAIGDLSPAEIAIDLSFDLVFGAGTALLFYIGLHFNRRRFVN